MTELKSRCPLIIFKEIYNKAFFLRCDIEKSEIWPASVAGSVENIRVNNPDHSLKVFGYSDPSKVWLKFGAAYWITVALNQNLCQGCQVLMEIVIWITQRHWKCIRRFRKIWENDSHLVDIHIVPREAYPELFKSQWPWVTNQRPPPHKKIRTFDWRRCDKITWRRFCKYGSPDQIDRHVTVCDPWNLRR